MKSLIKEILNFVIFMIIVIFVYTRITYIYRDVNSNRDRITGIKNEEYDIVYIGGSEVHTYWQPMRAWGDKGWTSYCFSTDGIPYEITLNLIKEIEKYQEPELYVISLRNINNVDDDKSEGHLRNATDAMSVFSLNRISTINNYLRVRDIEGRDFASLYLDLIFYHSKMMNPMLYEEYWNYINNNSKEDYCKGYEWNDGYTFLPKPSSYQEQDAIPMSSKSMEELRILLDYISENNLNVLFTVNPYYAEIPPALTYFEAEGIINEYGYELLDLNRFYDDMNLDFSTDFTDDVHANCLGAEKFTKYLEEYIGSNYCISDHRNDDEYQDWNEDYIMFLEEEKSHKDVVWQMIEENR